MNCILYEFNENQFIQFLKFIHFLDFKLSYDLWWEIYLKSLCVEKEYYSKLTIESGTKRWICRTKQNTLLKAHEEPVNYILGIETKSHFSVHLPVKYKNGFDYNFLELLKVNPEFVLFPEKEMLQAEKGSKQYKSALVIGLNPYCDRKT